MVQGNLKTLFLRMKTETELKPLIPEAWKKIAIVSTE